MAIAQTFPVQFIKVGVSQAVKLDVGMKIHSQQAEVNYVIAQHVAAHQETGHQLHAVPIKPVQLVNV